MKTALVLSAGGPFGAYQAGIWKALQPVVRPDVVIGASIGSINGWAIASGMPPDDLIRIWLDPRCAALLTRRAPWRPWRSFFDPAPLRQMIEELTSAWAPKIPFAVALTRLPQLRIEIVRTPHLTFRHILASCAIPFGYPPVRVDGRLYCDGGLLSVMPLWAAADFGVERAIAVNVLPSAPLNAVRATLRIVRLMAPREPRLAGIEVLPLGPKRVLGGLRDAMTWDTGNTRRWIDRGQADAEAFIRSHNLRRCAAGLDRFV